ncbi:phosphatase PAP2 family protein [Paracoccus liaowanqingii]|nr:phosphatase PAP2 family protein [Paracoccus liaowanqingii]
MNDMARRADGAPDAASSIEEADKDVAGKAARHRDHPAVRALGAVSEIADQTPLALVCAGVTVAGVLTGRPRLARTGLDMMAAHVLANLIKRAIKNRVRRTRPNKMIEKRTYRFEPDEGQGGDESSFPSGHTAGAVAVATAMACNLPRTSVPVLLAAAVVAGIQVPRAKHYPMDVAAGAVLGLASALVVRAVSSKAWRMVESSQGTMRSLKDR